MRNNNADLLHTAAELRGLGSLGFFCCCCCCFLLPWCFTWLKILIYLMVFLFTVGVQGLNTVYKIMWNLSRYFKSIVLYQVGKCQVKRQFFAVLFKVSFSWCVYTKPIPGTAVVCITKNQGYSDASFFKMHWMCFIFCLTYQIFHVMPGEIPINVIAAFPIPSGYFCFFRLQIPISLVVVLFMWKMKRICLFSSCDKMGFVEGHEEYRNS